MAVAIGVASVMFALSIWHLWIDHQAIHGMATWIATYGPKLEQLAK